MSFSIRNFHFEFSGEPGVEYLHADGGRRLLVGGHGIGCVETERTTVSVKTASLACRCFQPQSVENEPTASVLRREISL